MLRRFAREEAPGEALAIARPYEERYATRFSSFTVFPPWALAELHFQPSSGTLPPELRVASGAVDELAGPLELLSRAAARDAVDAEARRSYARAVFELLPEQPQRFARSPDVLCVGPEREGRTLAIDIGCEPEGRSVFPATKRMPFRGGLMIGMSDTPERVPYQECIVVDDVIASGATLIALMGALSGSIDTFRVFAAHGTPAGVWAISRYAGGAGLDVTISVGRVGGRLGSDFRVVDCAAGDWLVLDHAISEA
jgi:hypothetical protein